MDGGLSLVVFWILHALSFGEEDWFSLLAGVYEDALLNFVVWFCKFIWLFCFGVLAGWPILSPAFCASVSSCLKGAVQGDDQSIVFYMISLLSKRVDTCVFFRVPGTLLCVRGKLKEHPPILRSPTNRSTPTLELSGPTNSVGNPGKFWKTRWSIADAEMGVILHGSRALCGHLGGDSRPETTFLRSCLSNFVAIRELSLSILLFAHNRSFLGFSEVCLQNKCLEARTRKQQPPRP